MSKFTVRYFTIEAGGEEMFTSPSEFVRCLAASADFKLGIDGNSPTHFEQGLMYTAPLGQSFERITVKNPNGSPLTVRLATGTGDFKDSRAVLSGAVKIGAGGSTFSDTTVTVGSAAVLLLAANENRTSAIIRAGAGDLYLGPSNAVTATGLATVSSGQALTIGHTGDVWAIRIGAGQDAAVYEETA